MNEPLPAGTWTHHNPVRIVAGNGMMSILHSLLPHQGKILLVTTSGFTSRGTTARLLKQFGGKQMLIYDDVTPNPQLDALDQATERFRDQGIVGIIALGGGSAMDTGKILSITLASVLPKPLNKILRHSLKKTWNISIPVVAIPTTAGTGAEVTPFATVWDKITYKKHSVAGQHVYPTYALLDPELTLSLPYRETLYTGLDAISHSLESLWNKNKTPVSEGLAIQALRLANKSFPMVLESPKDIAHRANMQSAAALAGLAISQTRTAIAHSISYPLTSRFGVPHGLACSFTLLALLERNWPNLNHLAVIKETENILKSFHLENEISRYAKKVDILSLVSQMVSSERSENYIGLNKAAEIECLLRRSTK